MRRFYLSVVDKPLVDTKRDLPIRTGPFIHYIRVIFYSSTAACAAARRAIGTRKGEQEA